MSAVESPLLPHALDAEEALLGSILIDPTALLVARSLQPADFYRAAHATIFATMRQLEADGLPVDVVTLTTRLERTGQLEAAGGSGYLTGLVNAVPTSLNAPHYADLVKKAAQGRQVIHFAGNLASIGYHSTDPAKAAARAVKTLTAAQDGEEGLDLSPEEARARLATLAPTVLRLDALMRQNFPPTLWIVPDLVPEGLTLLAAKPKLGKSWLALSLALAVASGSLALGKVQVEQGAVLYLALEDSPKRLHTRAGLLLGGASAPAALEIGTTWPRLDEGGLRLLEVWLHAHPGARLMILDTLAKIRGQARSATLYGDDYASLEQAQALAHRYGVGILVIHHTGKESREDPLDEVNATQGLNGVADNVLVLRRERGKPTATLIGDGRELTGIEQTLTFDLHNGGWRLTDAPPSSQPKTPERAEILALLKASAQPMSPKQIAEALGKHPSTIRSILPKMVQEGEVKTIEYGKYIPLEGVDSVDSVDTSRIKKDETRNTSPLFEKKECTSELGKSTESTESTGAGKPEAEPAPAAGDENPLVPPPSPAASDGAEPDAERRRLEEFIAFAMPDALQPHTLMPSGLTPGWRIERVPKEERLWPLAGDCTGVFCQGECVCGDHLCDACACEAGALIDNHPWYYERHQPRRGARCEYCFAPATVASRWKTPMCERCWQIASRGLGINPRAYQPRPFGPIEGDEDEPEDAAAGE